MRAYTNDEKARLNALGREFDLKVSDKRDRQLQKLGEDYSAFIYLHSRGKNGSKLFDQLCNDMRNRNIKKPSEFFKKSLLKKNGSAFFDTLIPKSRQTAFLYIIDHIHELQYARSSYRRSHRTTEPLSIAYRVRSVTTDFCKDPFDADICDILEDKLPDEQLGYKLRYPYFVDNNYDLLIAAEIDLGNQRLIDIIKDVLNCSSDVALSRSIIRGVFMCHNHELHVLMGKLLLAAKLQEGLRQAICENMDCGTAEAFLTVLEVLEKNDLIRFSSVKRAVGTWLGLISEETRDLDRVSGKSLRLISECLTLPEKRESYLSSEDSMEIYIALWSFGFYEVSDMLGRIRVLALNGTRHQVLTAGYAVCNTEGGDFRHSIAKYVVEHHSDDKEIMAVYLNHFIPNPQGQIRLALDRTNLLRNNEKRKAGVRKYISLEENFDDKEDAEKFYGILMEMYRSFKGKEQVFSPCIFPWFSASLLKSEIATRLCMIASALRDEDKIDETCQMIPEIAYCRSEMLDLLLSKPQTSIQRRMLTASLCDKETYTRDVAAAIVPFVTLEEENYLQMEELLRYKAAGARAEIIKILTSREDEKVYGSISRLLSDKKEEKRTAALDMVSRISVKETKTELFGKCVELVKNITSPTTKEKILIDAILGNGQEKEEEPLYSDEDIYNPIVADTDYYRECVAEFMKYFPSSQLGNLLYPDIYKKPDVKCECEEHKQVKADILSLCRLVEKHRNEEFVLWRSGETATIDSCHPSVFGTKDENGKYTVPLMNVWEKWFDENIDSVERLLRMYVCVVAPNEKNGFTVRSEKYIEQLYGTGFSEYIGDEFIGKAACIISHLMYRYKMQVVAPEPAVAIALWYYRCVPGDDVRIEFMQKYGIGNSEYRRDAWLVSHCQILLILGYFTVKNDEYLDRHLPLMEQLWKKCNAHGTTYRYGMGLGYHTFITPMTLLKPSINTYIIAAYKGVITERMLYRWIFDKNNTDEAFTAISNIKRTLVEQGRLVSSREHYWSARARDNAAMALVDRRDLKEPFTEEETKLLRYAEKIYDTVIAEVLSTELKRGDTPTKYSVHVKAIRRIYGTENFVAILSAMGKDTLERTSWHSTETKKASLSHLLGVCVPMEGEEACKLGELLKNTDITEKRLIEAALYSPEWIDIVGEYLGWTGFRSGAYYFMAHMNETFDDKRKAIIAKYTPLSQTELNDGAFDVNWFRSAYEELGEKRFNMVYDAAKYISDGTKHSRGRKYADATLGKMKPQETAAIISDKRNKDLLMAYSLIPLENDDDISTRYLFLQKFLKESKKFGAQRSASEKRAVEISMQNLSINAGFADVTRLTLRMETKLLEDNRDLFEGTEVEDVNIRLTVDEQGKVSVVCEKGGKTLKAVPAKLKKNEFVLRINEMKKALTEQHRRSKAMFETAMEDCTEFTFGEIISLYTNPVVYSIVSRLVFEADGKWGLLTEKGITDYEGNTLPLDENTIVTVVHPVVLYRNKNWAKWQKYIFDNRIVQPFKQIFREVYVMTEEERKMNRSLRYSGNQIQPAKTKACLKTRRWVADVENGIQKVYYNDNIIATIYAMADWFSPSDIEAPTLEWVCFYDRKTGKAMTMEEIPDIVFSEVMRDVDMAVSVAHAGGVDPEASHSTIEMRSAIISCTLPLFRLANVELSGSHAHIKGKYGEYTIHLGSGVIHMRGGAMIAVLPVHSQHRGRLFLPFIDDDPKTAEIITKILFFAEDEKIKDPEILRQIKGGNIV